MLTSILGLPLFPWTPLKGYALGDANYENFRYLNHFVATDQAQSVREYDRIQRQYQGIPWVNSVAADRRGEAYYSMDGAIPNVSDDKATTCAGSLGVSVFPATGIPILDGSRAACNWDTDSDSVVSGIFGPSRIPRLFRDDYVTNGNDSHWLSNPEQPLEGYERVIGDERTQRSLRTRLGLVMVQQRIAGTDGKRGEGFSLRKLARVALGNRQYAGELWRDELVALCNQSSSAEVTAACPVLAGWSGRNDLDAPGAVLFQRFTERLLDNFQSVPTGVSSSQAPGDATIYDNGFDVADPVNTPNGLNTDNPAVASALEAAVRRSHRSRDPRRWHPARVPVRPPRRRAHPDPRRAGDTGHLQRDQLDLEPGVGLLQHPPRHQLHRRDGLLRQEIRLPGEIADLRHLRPVRERELSACSRLHQGLLAQALESGALLRRPGAPQDA